MSCRAGCSLAVLFYPHLPCHINLWCWMAHILPQPKLAAVWTGASWRVRVKPGKLDLKAGSSSVSLRSTMIILWCTTVSQSVKKGRDNETYPCSCTWLENVDNEEFNQASPRSKKQALGYIRMHTMATTMQRTFPGYRDSNILRATRTM